MSKHTLKSARVYAGLSVSKAAEKLNVSRVTLRNWEIGATYPTAPQFLKLCKLYGIGPDDIFFEKLFT